MSDVLLARIMSRRLVVPSGCWEWQGALTKGYGEVWDGNRPALVHRLAYALLVAPIPDGLCVLHRCDNPPCFNPEHLFLGTLAENAADMAAKGRARSGNVRGEAHGMAKLTASDVDEIRSSTESQRALARQFGVGQTQIWRIRNGQAWA